METAAECLDRIRETFRFSGVTTEQLRINLSTESIGRFRPDSRAIMPTGKERTMDASFSFSPGDPVIVKLTSQKGTVCSCTVDNGGNGYTVRTANSKGEFTRTYFEEFELAAGEPELESQTARPPCRGGWRYPPRYLSSHLHLGSQFQQLRV